MRTTWYRGPVEAEPNFDNLLAVIGRQEPERPTLFEFYLNPRLDTKETGGKCAVCPF